MIYCPTAAVRRTPQLFHLGCFLLAASMTGPAIMTEIGPFTVQR